MSYQSSSTIKIEITEHVSVTLQGRVDAFNVPELRQKLDGYLKKGATNFLVDLAEVSFMDSAGLAALVSLLKYSRSVMGDVKLVWPKNPDAQRILKLTRFDRVFKMVNNIDDGVKCFTSA